MDNMDIKGYLQETCNSGTGVERLSYTKHSMASQQSAGEQRLAA